LTTVFLILIAIESYFLGGLNGAIIISKYILRKDIRKYGSGNAGLANTYRTFGLVAAAIVLLIDILKSVIAILIGAGLMSFSGYPMVGKLFAGFCLMLGHTYPILYQFRGGKGALCAGVMAVMVDWRIGILCLGIFVGVIIFTRFVSLGSMIGSMVFPLAIWAFGYGGLEGLLGLLCALFVVFNHRSNIVRLYSGREPRLNFHGSQRKKSAQEDDFIE